MMVSRILEEFNSVRENSPILFLDYDGTLVPIIKDPEKSYPDEELVRLLEHLRSEYETYIVTGRSLREIQTFLGTGIDVIALHGAIVWKNGRVASSVEGYERYRRTCDQLFEKKSDFKERYPGVHIINKEGGLVFTKWYLKPDLYGKLEREICGIAEKEGMECYLGKMIVELRIPDINKGKAILEVRGGRPALIAGDDTTDEDAFRTNPDAITIRVGDGNSSARYSVADYLEFRELLKKL